MAEQSVTHFYKFEKKLKYFEGYLSFVETIYKDDASMYCKTAIALKQNKDDEPLWLNCRVFEPALAHKFSEECRKGAKVGLEGEFYESADVDGKKYINFNVKNYALLKEPTEKV